jgi:hypothetical protein
MGQDLTQHLAARSLEVVYFTSAGGFDEAQVLNNAPSANLSIGVNPDYNSQEALLFRRLFPHPSYSGRSRKGECSNADKPALEEGYFCGTSPIFKRRFLSWSPLQYLQSRRIKSDVYGMVIFVFSTST